MLYLISYTQRMLRAYLKDVEESWAVRDVDLLMNAENHMDTTCKQIGSFKANRKYQKKCR